MIVGNLNLTVCVESQRAIWFIFPLCPIFLIFFIGAIAETNRAPFDLAEAESELVSGFMTEHAAVIFVFFFLAEYGSILLMCILTNILFFGGYIYLNELMSIIVLCYYIFSIFTYIILKIIILISYGLNYFINIIDIDFFFKELNNLENEINYIYMENLFNTIINNPILEGLIYGLSLGIKSMIIVFTFIWVRASFPRIRFDQLMSFC
jgi:NADH-ubiquinone oxidoreductase chain 1